MKKDTETYVEYSHNNSGGSWWLTDQNWLDLEKAGWIVDWARNRKDSVLATNGRVLGALATEAKKYDDYHTIDEAIREWEQITGLSASDPGCSCCGRPHYFSFYRNGKRS